MGALVLEFLFDQIFYTEYFAIEQHILDTKAGKTTVSVCHRCLINTGVEKMNNI
jgi:hypothetical protein